MSNTEQYIMAFMFFLYYGFHGKADTILARQMELSGREIYMTNMMKQLIIKWTIVLLIGMMSYLLFQRWPLYTMIGCTVWFLALLAINFIQVRNWTPPQGQYKEFLINEEHQIYGYTWEENENKTKVDN